MKSRSLNFKIGSVITVLILGSVSIAYIGLSKMHHMDEIISEMVTHTVARAMLAKDVRSLVDAQAIDQRNILLAETPDEAGPYIKKIETRHEEILEDMNAFLAMSKIPKEDMMNRVQAEYLSWYNADHQVIDLALKGHHKEAMVASKEITLPIRMKMDEEIVDMVHEQELLLEKEKAEADADYQAAKQLVLVFSAVSIILSILFAVAVLRSLSTLIQGVINDLNGGSEQVTEASQQIAEASVQLSHASTEQASSLEETVAAVEELTSVVKLNSDHAKNASQLADEARNIALQGDVKIHGLMSSMTAIADDSKKIEEIISVIEGIAFQTNLLALNAAVEAARAGEQGKGFAVVADAVRTLSQRTTSASKDISTLIRSSVEKVSLGESQAKESGEVLGKVLEAIKKVSELNTEIAAANAEQSNGISQISQAMNQLDQATQINAATSEEAAASAEELSAQAVQMRNVVKLLNKAINGESSKLRGAMTGPAAVSGSGVPSNVMSFKPKAKTMADFESPQWAGRKVSNTEGF